MPAALQSESFIDYSTENKPNETPNRHSADGSEVKATTNNPAHFEKSMVVVKDTVMKRSAMGEYVAYPPLSGQGR